MSAAAAVKHSETEKRNCSFCGEFADDDLSITHRQCGGRTHADCLPTGKAVNYKLCCACTGETVALGDVQSMDVAPPSQGPQGSGGGREPFPPDGIDYVLQPGAKSVQSNGGAWTMVTGIFSRSKATAPPSSDVKTSQDPEFLLKNRVPVRDMLRFNKLGLQHLLKLGFDMTDFLSNGYTWNDLLLYEDIGRKGANRAKQALLALRCNANHFRDYPDALPYSKVAAHAQLRPYDLGTCFGLGFPLSPPGPLQCAGDQEWTARDCVRLGLTMDDLRDFGLIGLQQYEDLMLGLSKADAMAAEKELKVTVDHIGALMDLEAKSAPAPKPAAKPVPKPAPKPQVSVIQNKTAPFVEYEEEAEPVRLQQQQTIARPIIVTVASPPPSAQAAAPRPIVVVPAANSKNRFDRHGALVRIIK